MQRLQGVSRKSQRAIVVGAGLVLVGTLAGGLTVRAWVVPALIVGQLETLFGGKVTIDSWWIGRGSAGVIGLTVHEGRDPGSPVWATAHRVETDVSLAGLLRGRFAPRRIGLHRPDVRFRLDREGRFLFLPSLGGSGSGHSTALPAVSAREGRLTFQAEGRPVMKIEGIVAGLAPGPHGTELTGATTDPAWGRWDAHGKIEPDFTGGTIEIGGTRVKADRSTLEKVVFVPSDVLDHVVPHGPVGVALSLAWGSKSQAAQPVQVRIALNLERTDATFPSLDLSAGKPAAGF